MRMFFVISGFVIPLSLDNGQYQMNNYLTFLYKRFLRLHIPFLCAVALTLGIMIVSYHGRGLPFPETFTSIVKMCVYLHVPVDNGVFWTLGIEAQYYIFIGLFFILIFNFPKITVGLIIPILVLVARITHVADFVSLSYFLIFFLLGNVGYLIYVKKGWLFINYFVLTGLLLYILLYYGIGQLIPSLITITIILYISVPIPKIFKFFGTISYSLYLIHYPIGMKLINAFKVHIDTRYDFFLFFGVLGIIIFLSWLFCKFIEYPSERLSRKLKYN